MKDEFVGELVCGIWLLMFSAVSACLPGRVGAQESPPAFRFGGYGTKFNAPASFEQDLTVLSRLKSPAIGIAGMRPYLLEGLNSGTMVAGLPVAPGGFGLLLQTNKYTGFSESRAGLCYARALTGQVAIGAGAGYRRWVSRGYEAVDQLLAELGLGLQLSPVLRSGLRVSNALLGSKHMQIRCGLGYEPGETWYGSLEVMKLSGEPALLQLGFGYRPVTRVTISAGFSTGRDNWWLSFGYQLAAFRIDLCSSFHQQLGLSPGLCIAWSPSTQQIVAE